MSLMECPAFLSVHLTASCSSFKGQLMCVHHCKALHNSQNTSAPHFAVSQGPRQCPPWHSWRMRRKPGGRCGTFRVCLYWSLSCVILLSSFALFRLAEPWLQLLLGLHLSAQHPPSDLMASLLFLTPRAISVIPHPYLVPIPEIPSLATDLIPYPPEQGVVRRAWKFFREETVLSLMCPIVLSGT